MAWESLDWWDLWDWQKVVVANPTKQIDKMLGLLGYKSYAIEQRFTEHVGDIWEGHETDRPSNTLAYWWTRPSRSKKGTTASISFDTLICAIGALAQDAWVMVAREHSVPVTDLYMREESVYSPNAGMRYDATFYDSREDEELEGAETQKRTREFAPELNGQMMAELTAAIGAEEWERLLEASKIDSAQREGQLEGQGDVSAESAAESGDSETSGGQAFDPVFRSLEGEPLPFLFKYDESKRRIFVVDCFSDEREVVVPETVSDNGREINVGGLSKGCFSRSKNLESVVLPSSVEYIEPGAFKGIESKLRSVRFERFPEGETIFRSMGRVLKCVLSPEEELVIPRDIERISRFALSGCWRLRTLVLHDKVKLPTERALASAPYLTCVILADGSKVDIADWGAVQASNVQDDFMEGILASEYERRGIEF